MTRQIGRSLLFSLVTLMVFSGIAAAQQPKHGGTLRIAFESDVPGMDPHTSLGVQVQVLIPSLFNTLVTIDENLEVIPDLASSWEVKDDGKTYVFHLHKGVKFHDGTDFDAVHGGRISITPLKLDLTDEAASFVFGEGDGLLSIFVPHSTAGVAIFETGAGTDGDLLSHLGDLFPRDDRWAHRHGSPGHGADHVVPAFVAPSITVPVVEGRLQLGTWQSIVLVDTSRDNTSRKVRLSFLPG